MAVIKVSGGRISFAEKGRLFSATDSHMKVSGKNTKPMVMAYSSTTMARLTKGSGKTTNKTVLACISGLLMSITQDIGARDANRARESWYLLMEVSIKGSLVVTNFMGMGSTSTKKGSRPIRAPGNTIRNQDGVSWS